MKFYRKVRNHIIVVDRSRLDYPEADFGFSYDVYVDGRLVEDNLDRKMKDKVVAGLVKKFTGGRK